MNNMIKRSFSYEGRRYWIYGANEEELIRKKLEKIREIQSNRITIDKSITVKKWANLWIKNYKERTVTDRTLKDITSVVNNVIVAGLGNTPLYKVKPIHLQGILNNLDEYSKSYVIKCKNYMEGIFTAAVDNELIERNPAEHLTMPNVKDGTRRALTEDERTAFLSACEDCGTAGLWGLILYYCGLRPSEATRIKGEDVDYNRRFIHVRGTKTENADRYVPIPDKLRLPVVEKDEYILTGKNGAMTKNARRRAWQKIVRRMNIEMGCEVNKKGRVIPPYKVADDLVPYCLRHNYATMLQEAGVDIGVASNLLGHANTATTSRIYTHYNTKSLVSAKSKLDGYL